MAGPDDLRKNYLRDSDLFRQPDPDKVELAYQLQNMQNADLDVIQLMIQRYTATLYKWVAVLLYYQLSDEPDQVEIVAVLRDVYIKAMHSIDQFHGHASVENWLFSIAQKVAKKYIHRNLHGANGAGQGKKTSPKSIFDSEFRLERLPYKLLQVVILRYMFDRDISDIAHILDVQRKEVHKRLVQGRAILFGDLNTVHMTTGMKAYLDGLIGDDKKAAIEQHLVDCTQCQQLIIIIRDKEESLSKEIKTRWEQNPISDDLIQMLVSAVTPEVENSNGAKKVRFTFRQAAWIAGLTAAFIGLAVLFIRITPTDDEFPSPEPTATQVLPAIIEMQPAILINPKIINPGTTPHRIIPEFTSDGNLGVFTSIYLDPKRNVPLLPKVEFYERATNTIQVIHQSDNVLSPYWKEQNLSASISDDGRWIAFPSIILEPMLGGNQCTTITGIECLDIFLYDTEHDQLKRISQGIDGVAADGNSVAPTISDDGRYVAFWSAASNLTGEGHSDCQPDERNIVCLFVHVYDRENGLVVKIPIPSILPDPSVVVDRISLSADGRYAAFSIYLISELSETSGVTYGLFYDIYQPSGLFSQINNTTYPNFHLDAIVYDLETNTAELVDAKTVTSKGIGSYSPVLSADGRYVAFISDTNVLVHGDYNLAGDVFVRDRLDGTVERISKDAFDLPGYSPGEFTDIGERFYNLNLSADGRYVVFLAKGPNWSWNPVRACKYMSNKDCRNLYAYDRQTGVYESLSVNLDNSYSLYPKITADGNWISFIQTTSNCNASQFICSNVMIYNKQNDWLGNLTNYGGESPHLPWIYRSSIDLIKGIPAKRLIAISPTGGQVAVTAENGRIFLGQVNEGGGSINITNHFKILEARSSDNIVELEYSPDGNWLIGGSDAGKVYIWNLSEGGLLYTVPGPTGAIRNMVFSNDGSQFIVSTIKEIWVWRIDESHLTKVNSILIDENPIYDLKISPMGNLAASARGDGIVWLQTLPDGKTIGRLGGSREVIHNVAFSLDGSLLVTNSSEGRINLWQIGYPTGEIPTITPLSSFVAKNINERMVISPDNKLLAIYGSRDDVMIWSVIDREYFSTIDVIPNRRMSDLAFSTGSPYVAGIIDDEIFLWEMLTAKSTNFFSHAPGDSFLEVEPLASGTANDIPELMEPSPGFSGKSLDLEQVAAYLHFPMLVPTDLPEYITFREAMINNDGSLRLWYQVSYPEGSEANLYIVEKIIGDSIAPTMTIGASAEVIPVKVESMAGQTIAEYVRGDWIQSMSFTEPISDSAVGEVHSAWHWDSSSTSQRLRWQQYAILVALYYKGDNGYVQVMGDNGDTVRTTNNWAIDTQDLIQIANSMKWYHEVRGSSWQETGTTYE